MTPTNAFVIFDGAASMGPPAEPEILRLWSACVRKGQYLAVAIGPNTIADVKHNGAASVGSTYGTMDGRTLRVSAVRKDPVSVTDLRLATVAEDVQCWVPMIPDELRRVAPERVIYIGAGTGKSAEVRDASGRVIGWEARGPQGAMGWAEVPVPQYPLSADDNRNYLVVDFHARPGFVAPTGGCSGSPLFARVRGQWYVVGLTQGVSGALWVNNWYAVSLDGSYFGGFGRATDAERDGVLGLPGDVNADGKVDFADQLIIGQNYGRVRVTRRAGDLNGDGTVDFSDFVLLAQHYGKTA